MAKKQAKHAQGSEERIKEAARKVFTRKGYAATRTRDIAEEAGINLALLNYYFRSKEKLFQVIMFEKVEQIFGILRPVINDPTTTLMQKVELLATHYIDLMLENPDLPFFVLYEMKNNPTQFSSHVGGDSFVRKSELFRQFKEVRPGEDPIPYLINLFSLIIFPFVAQPLEQHFFGMGDRAYRQSMEDRKKQIPRWIKILWEQG
jgi:AcrR family transcriptional regulator